MSIAVLLDIPLLWNWDVVERRLQDARSIDDGLEAGGLASRIRKLPKQRRLSSAWLSDFPFSESVPSSAFLWRTVSLGPGAQASAWARKSSRSAFRLPHQKPSGLVHYAVQEKGPRLVVSFSSPVQVSFSVASKADFSR